MHEQDQLQGQVNRLRHERGLQVAEDTEFANGIVEKKNGKAIFRLLDRPAEEKKAQTEDAVMQSMTNSPLRQELIETKQRLEAKTQADEETAERLVQFDGLTTLLAKLAEDQQISDEGKTKLRLYYSQFSSSQDQETADKAGAETTPTINEKDEF